MIEQIIYVLLGIIGITCLNSISIVLSNKLSVNYSVIILPIFGLLVYSIYPITSINVASIGSDIHGVIAGSTIGLYNSTIGILIAKRFSTMDEIKWKITPKGVFLGVLIPGIISIISIYIYKLL